MKLIPVVLLLILTMIPASATQWYSYEEGMVEAGVNNKPVLIEFYADWCPPCVAMEENTFPDPRVVSEMEGFVAVRVENNPDVEKNYGVEYYPTIVLLNREGKETSRYIGYLGPEEMVDWIIGSRDKSPEESPGFEIASVLFAVILLFFAKKVEL